MLSTQFQIGSPLHLATLGVCAVVLAAFALYLVRERQSGMTRAVVGWGCLVVWILNTAAWATPERLDWARSLPLHFCNIANLFGAIAVLKRSRFFQGVIYFWALGLAVWAFVVPTLDMGPARFGFWIFWCYHLFIGLAVVTVLVLDRFRPAKRDLVSSVQFTLAYMLVLAVLDWLFGWNYGFVGPTDPALPSPAEALGPYPLRVLWMALGGSFLFGLLWLPFRKRSGEDAAG